MPGRCLPPTLFPLPLPFPPVPGTEFSGVRRAHFVELLVRLTPPIVYITIRREIRRLRKDTYEERIVDSFDGVTSTRQTSRKRVETRVEVIAITCRWTFKGS
jgi:hypothetical protein